MSTRALFLAWQDKQYSHQWFPVGLLDRDHSPRTSLRQCTPRSSGSPLAGPAYSAANAGVINFTQYLNAEFKNSGLRASVITQDEDGASIAECPAALSRGTGRRDPVRRLRGRS